MEQYVTTGNNIRMPLLSVTIPTESSSCNDGDIQLVGGIYHIQPSKT